MRKTSRIKYREEYSGGRVEKTGLEVKISRLQRALKALFYNTSSPCNRTFRYSGLQHPCVAIGRSQLHSLPVCSLAQFYSIPPDKFQARN